MKVLPASVLLCCGFLVAAETSSLAAPIKKDEVNYQNYAFKQWYGTTLIWRFDRIPTKGAVAKHRVPYAGCIYPDQQGGTSVVLTKYDRAFNGRQSKATDFEWRDIATRGAPYWAGHCNGWTAAAIRHAEPQKSVKRNGIVFTPADIKGLMAETYAYSDSEFLGGVDAAINPGTLHVVITNWIGRGKHPVGVETSVGQEVWNYPAFAFKSSSKQRNERSVEVKLNLGHVDFIESEVNRAPKKYQHRYFHYLLTLNEDGEIVDGKYMRDSDRVDMLWVPLQPTKGGTKGNEDGNPHLDPAVVLAMWRESVPEAVRARWYVVDPSPEDATIASDWFRVNPSDERIGLLTNPEEIETRAATLEEAVVQLSELVDEAVADESQTDLETADYPQTEDPDLSVQGSDAFDATVPAQVVAAVPEREQLETGDQLTAAAVTRTPDAEQPESEPEVEIFRERFPDGTVKVEREVILDAGFNYVNHGMFRQWREDGTLVGEGRFVQGRRVGPWMRILAKNSSKSLSHKPFTLFQEPFLSQASFRDGKLQDKWTITDSKGRTVIQIDFVDGVRHGNLYYFFPDGSKSRELIFNHGVIDGHFRDYDDAGGLVREAKYIDGHYRTNHVETFVSTTKKSETGLHYPPMKMTSPDDWWNAELAKYSIEEGKPVRHGPRFVWYENGQQRFSGEFDLGLAVGEFVWWLENGQVLRKGAYVNGKQHGRWVWWHNNGAKAVEGYYENGSPAGRWLFWNLDGGLAQAKHLNGSADSHSQRDLQGTDVDGAAVMSQVESPAADDVPIVSPMSSMPQDSRR